MGGGCCAKWSIFLQRAFHHRLDQAFEAALVVTPLLSLLRSVYLRPVKDVHTAGPGLSHSPMGLSALQRTFLGSQFMRHIDGQ